MKTRPSTIIAISVISILLVATAALRASPVSASVCSPAGGTGLTASMIATSHQTISGITINAAGCDVGIYIGPGTNHVDISGVTVTGANDHAIFAQDASQITVENSFVSGNGLAPHTCAFPGAPGPCIAENKAIQFVGTTNSQITGNVVSHNSADGGIGIADDGPASVGGDPAALSASATKPTPSHNDEISGNTIVDNENGCGIVVASYDANVGVKDIKVEGNTVIGVAPSGAPNSGPYGGPGSFYGQIVVAGDGPFAQVSNVKVDNNVVSGSLLPGIVVHSNVFGDTIDNTEISGNTVANNGYYPPFFGPPGDTNTPLAPTLSNGISVVAEVGVQPPHLGPDPTVSHTHIKSNTILADNNGVWLCGTDHTDISHLQGNPTNPTATCPAGGN